MTLLRLRAWTSTLVHWTSFARDDQCSGRNGFEQHLFSLRQLTTRRFWRSRQGESDVSFPLSHARPPAKALADASTFFMVAATTPTESVRGELIRLPIDHVARGDCRTAFILSRAPHQEGTN